MLNHHEYGGAPAPQSSPQRFLASTAGTLSELKTLLIDPPCPIEAGTGAQIAQMLRAIREAAGTFGLDAISRSAARIETYLLSNEAYVAGGSLRNFVLGSQIDDLQDLVTEATEAS